ncbi:hypothetical protein [Pacificoceanicola onchidii]|uniref:hypothetical protein n=1 Tax=Pacificoceanicola onchidii TaxID=2562685 RepID=UPI0010A4255E|nr:hypothetical protein [Pacificoceanicola onchidii]
MADAQQWQTVWIPLISAAIGGGMAIMASLVALRKQHELEIARENDRARREASNRAFACMHKLQSVLETSENLRRAINRQFVAANEEGAGDLEPWAKVVEIVADDYKEEAISVSETAFLIDAKRAELMNDVHLIQRRVWHLLAASKKYNALRAELVKFMEEHHQDGQPEDGLRVSGSFSGKAAFVADMRQKQLQNLLGQLMDGLETDTEEAWRVLLAFKQTAEEYFEGMFPVFKLERDEKC